jgi:hypothetical protein
VSANNHYAGFGPGTANIFRKMSGLPEAAWSKEEGKNKKDEDDKSYLHSISSNIQHFRFYDITISFIAYNSSIQLGSNGSSKR